MDDGGRVRSVGDAGLDEAGFARLRSYRLTRCQAELAGSDCGAAVLFDPCNIRYATDTRNMAVWTLHNHVRYAFVPTEGRPVLFEFGAGKWPTPADQMKNLAAVLPPDGWTHFYSGSAKPERVKRFADRIAGLMREHCGGDKRIAFDHLDPPGLRAIEAEGLEVVDGEPILEHARLIKSPEEIACMRASVRVAEFGARRMRDALTPGLRENQLWAILHQSNIEHGGEWIDTRLLSSGPRTNPWMQESSDRVIQGGELVAFDTDMVGPYGYFADFSRTFLCGARQGTNAQRRLYAASFEQLAHNVEQMRAGRTLREVVESEWPFPDEYLAYRYGFAHGVGLKDEFPFLPNRADLDELGDPELLLEPGMTFSLESYIGKVGGAEGVKLEQQVLITADGPELLSHFPFEDGLM